MQHSITFGIFVIMLLCRTVLGESSATMLNHSQSPLQVPSPDFVLQSSADFEKRVVDFYVSNQCPKVVSMVEGVNHFNLKPLVIAVVAFCHKDRARAEMIFSQAEEKDPTDELIVLLRARYAWLLDPASSQLLWKRVMMLARNPAIKAMAQEYLNGTVEEGQVLTLSLGKKITYLAKLQVGGSYETNPTAQAISDAPVPTPSYAANTTLSVASQYAVGFGSINLNYSLIDSRYFSTKQVNYQEHNLDIPVALRVGDSEDIQVRPFASYTFLGDTRYQMLAGIGVMGVAYRADFKQSAQGSIFQDKYFSPDLVAQQGFHYRFQYDWEFFPPDWFLKFLFYVEHVTASSDIDTSSDLSITYSHNDIGLQFFIQYSLKWISFGFNPKFLLREDDNDSAYQDPNGNPISRRREDLQLSLQPNISIPISQWVQLYLWYDFTRVFSTIGADAYVDRNIKNQTVGLAVRASFTNF